MKGANLIRLTVLFGLVVCNIATVVQEPVDPEVTASLQNIQRADEIFARMEEGEKFTWQDVSHIFD